MIALPALLSLLGIPSMVAALSGRSFTTWDCCKPACGDAKYITRSNATGLVTSCSTNNSPISNPRYIASGCDNGAAYLCDRYQPIPVADDLSYGFAVAPGYNCCKCYELFWLDGYAAGKRMVVQVVNWMPDADSGTSDAGRTGDFAILTPGGGSGPHPAGCQKQYGANWGDEFGGVDSMEACADLPSNLQGGCYWRWNWAGGEISGWNVEYKQVECPARLTEESNCSPAAM